MGRGWSPGDEDGSGSRRILETLITWEMVEKLLQSAFRTKVSFGPNKRTVQIGIGEGYASRIARIYLDWIDSAADSRILPKSVIIKIPSPGWSETVNIDQDIVRMVFF
ncbi:unnamed protein product [Gongylonema pulchrum]|uniref:DUF2235 domain-containing protein n=1 Tax=Gongylonema pulchrum TaxID=637853 RepID=A0A183E4K8_9BILA|nr:unnamed protein product [Gongylonema pulchrum]